MGKHRRGAGAQDSGSKSKKKKTNQNGSVRDVQACGAAAPVAATEAIHNKGKGKNRGKDGGESKTAAREETKQHDVDGGQGVRGQDGAGCGGRKGGKDGSRGGDAMSSGSSSSMRKERKKREHEEEGYEGPVEEEDSESDDSSRGAWCVWPDRILGIFARVLSGLRLMTLSVGTAHRASTTGHRQQPNFCGVSSEQLP